jgi:hypothetical protein
VEQVDGIRRLALQRHCNQKFLEQTAEYFKLGADD